MHRLLALFLLPLLFTISLKGDDPAWHRVKSRNFDVITNAGEKQGREVALQFEKMRNAFGILFNKLDVNMPVPLQIIALRSRNDMKPLLRTYNGKTVDMTGFYQQGDDKNFIVLDLSSPGGYSTVYHEYGHSVLNANFPRMQLWFDEGFAEFFSGMRPMGKFTIVGTQPYPGAIEQLRGSKLSLLDLFSVEHGSREYNENNKRSTFYLQSWLVVHYMIQRKMMPQLGQYFDLVLNHKVPIDQAITQAFGMPIKKLEDQIRGHLNDVRVYNVPTPESLEKSTFVADKLKDVEARVVLADLKLHMRDQQDQALAEFEAILKVAPENADAYRGLGYLFLRRNDYDRAAVNLKRAVDLGSTDPRVYYFNAMLLSRESSGSKALQMRSLLKKALELNPEYADAYSLLAFTEMSAGQTDDAIRWIKEAISLSPRNDRYRLDLAKYMLAGRADGAKTLLAFLSSSEDPLVATEASSLLQQIEAMGVDRYASEKKRERDNPMAYVDPRWRPKSGGGTIAELEEKPIEVETKPDVRRTEFMKGRLLKIDCSNEHEALITVSSATGKTWRMKTKDRDKLVLIGADKFSCGWSNRRVAVNYKVAGANTGDLVSLELQ